MNEYIQEWINDKYKKKEKIERKENERKKEGTKIWHNKKQQK